MAPSGNRAFRGQVPRIGVGRLVNWAHPAFANRHIVLRNDEEVIRVSMDQNDY